MKIRAYFQHMPPYSGAAALRGQSVVAGLVALSTSSQSKVEVYTTTPNARPLPGARVQTLPVREVENAEGLLSRIRGEVQMGLAAARAMFSDACDLAVISTPGYLAALVIAARARRKRVPYVLELRDVYPQVYAEAGLVSKTTWLYRFFEKRSQRLYEGAALVVCATQGLAREVARSAPRAQVAHVYNGFPASLTLRKPIKHERFTVCFHGTMGFFQDIETLVDVARRLQPQGVDVVVIGYGRKESLLRQSPLPNLRFLGRLPFDETIAEVERCHLGLCLRLDDDISRDAFPVKVWEYIGLGMPSVVTPPCEAGEFLQANGCGLQLPAGDGERIASEVLALRADSASLARMAQQCQSAWHTLTRDETGLAVARLALAAVRRD